ncbi:MAG: dicarboxylate/amino acid:cation symporter [Treponema sp.]|nr:dicarboxylate/amino acid:cation symporter [Treponema sp.]
MKLWLKYLLGIIIGLIAAFLLPVNSTQGSEVLDFILEIVIRFGRYMLIPLLFFSIICACYRLREDKKILKTGVWTFSVIIISSLMLVALGLASGLMVKLPRIPISPIAVGKNAEIDTLDIKNLIRALFPYSGFEALIQGAYLLPVFIFAGLAGAGAVNEKNFARPAITLFDSLSRLCYHIMSFFTEVLSVGMIAIMFKWTVDFISVQDLKVFMPLFILLVADFVIMAFVVYPLLTSIICHERHPWRILYASICPLFVAFFSGDTNLTLPVSMRHSHESLGIHRRSNAATHPLFAIFGRGGAALVVTVCFIQILRSYSRGDINTETAFWIAGFAFLISFALADRPSGGPFFALTLMCMAYGPNFEAGYHLLKGTAPILCAFAAGFDTISAMFGTYIVAVKTKNIQPQELKKYI